MAQANTKKQEGPKSKKAPEFRIYLGPPVASHEIHLSPGAVFRGEVKLPKDLGFLADWFFPVDKNLSRIRREIRTERSGLNLKYREAMKKVGEYMRQKREV